MQIRKIVKRLFLMTILMLMVILAATVAMANGSLLTDGADVPTSYALLIKKEAEGLPADQTGKEFHFTVSGNLANSGEFNQKVSIKAGETMLIQKVDSGTLTITEDEESAKVDGYDHKFELKYFVGAFADLGDGSTDYQMRFDTDAPKTVEIQTKWDTLYFSMNPDEMCPNETYIIEVKGSSERRVDLTQGNENGKITGLKPGLYSLTGWIERENPCGKSHGASLKHLEFNPSTRAGLDKDKLFLAVGTNTYEELGQLEIKKSVTGSQGDQSKLFTFTVTLKDKNGDPLTGQYDYTGSYTGKIENGGTVQLKHDESIIITGLPVGTQYQVTEKEANEDGYTTTVPENAAGAVESKEGQTVVFTNNKEPGSPGGGPSSEIISLTVEKKWVGDSEEDRPESIQVQLLKDGKPEDTKTLSGENGWKVRWDGLISKETSGTVHTYTVEEIDAPEGYTSSQKRDGNTITITNTKTDAETTSLTVRKVWEDGNDAEGLRPERVTVQLLRNGEALGEAVVLSEENGWTHTWEQLEKQDKDGQDITYTVKEAEVQGYTSSQSQTGSTVTLTNTREGTKPESETTSRTVNKVWDDNGNEAGLRPGSVTVELFRNGILADTVTLSEENGWTHTWETLEKRDPDGAEWVYTVKEHYVPGYSHQYAGSGEVLTVTNTYRPELPPSLPDPNDPDTPDEVTIPDGDVPRTFKKVPEGDEYTWIEDEDPPLAPGEPEVPRTGDSARLGLWTLLSALSLCGLGAALVLRRRRGN